MKDGTRQITSPADAAKMVVAIAGKLVVRDLNRDETLQTIELAQSRGVQGARIHDLLHARAASLADSDLILTRDDGFSTLGERVRSERP